MNALLGTLLWGPCQAADEWRVAPVVVIDVKNAIIQTPESRGGFLASGCACCTETHFSSFVA
ncbi:MAG: hypothetical protein ABSF54_17815, partial [Bryobacteraceae bacterium]